MYCYCLFCETAKCASVAAEAEKRMPIVRAIRPQRVQHTRTRDHTADPVHDLLPGYVFLYAKEKITDFSVLRTMNGFLRCLCDHERCYELQDADERFAMMLLEKNGVIGKTRVYQEGDRIRLCEGAFSGVTAEILKVDRRNMRMLIELPFAHTMARTWVEYETVQNEGD